MDENLTETQPKRSFVWRITRTIPLILLFVSAAVVVALLAAGGAPRVVGWYFLPFLSPIVGVCTLVLVGAYAVLKKRRSVFLVITMVVAVLSLLPGVLAVRPITYPASIEKMTPSATVRLPMDEEMLVAWGGDSVKTNYHASTPDQRWAYDFVVEPSMHGATDLEAYGCFGLPVLAPANGIVTQTVNDLPDELPGVLSNNIANPLGNHVVIQLETGTYLIIAHLQRGSVLVEAGDSVTESQKIGNCGNSGNTSEPHIHIHHQIQDPAVAPVGFAEGLPLFFRDHNGEPMPVGGIEVVEDNIFGTGDIVRHLGE